MSFEEYVYEYLKSSLEEYELSTKTKNEAIGVQLQQAADINKWVRDSTIVVTARFRGKRTSLGASEAVKETFNNLDKENFIMTVSLQAEEVDASGSPEHWEYSLMVSVRHRRRASWLL